MTMRYFSGDRGRRKARVKDVCPGRDSRTLKALIVDDNAHMRSLLRALLNSVGIKDMWRGRMHGGAAMDVLRERKSDLVLSLTWR